jgi:nucleotide-binding universal stress UspA family protein
MLLGLADILVCVDGSEKSKQVVDYSVDLSKKLGSKILLLFVTPDQVVPKEYEEYAQIEKVDLASYYSAIGEAALEKTEERLQGKGVQYETLLDVGSAAPRIVEIARLRKVDMIILGLQGLHGINRIRSLGSVSRRVLESAPCPVLVIHEGEK